MNGMILCEGNTDQILLSKFFSARYGFRYISEHKNCCQYKNQEEEILRIAYAEGKDRFPEALENVLKANKLDAPDAGVDYVAVIMDHDSDEEVSYMRQELEKILAVFSDEEVKDPSSPWSTWKQAADFGEIKTFRFILISIPLQENGALETFLLHALRDDEESEYLVKRSESFISDLIGEKKTGTASFPENVLKTRRLQIKAPLAVYFGVANPERTFDKFEEVLGSIDWAKYEAINNGFQAFESVLGKH